MPVLLPPTPTHAIPPWLLTDQFAPIQCAPIQFDSVQFSPIQFGSIQFAPIQIDKRIEPSGPCWFIPASEPKRPGGCNPVDHTEQNQQWIDALSGMLGEVRQSDAHGRLATHLFKIVRRYVAERRYDRNWLATFDDEELDALTQDIVQICLIKLSQDNFARLAQFSGIGRFEGWAIQIALNIVRSELRKVRWDRLQRLDSVATLPKSQVPSADQTIQQQHLQSVLTQCLAQLPDHYRTVLVRCIMHDDPTEEVAADLGRSVQAVYNLVSRAKKELKALLIEARISPDDLAMFAK